LCLDRLDNHSVRGSDFDTFGQSTAFRLRSESVSIDFHELRQGFIPPIQGMKNGLGRNVNETVLVY